MSISLSHQSNPSSLLQDRGSQFLFEERLISRRTSRLRGKQTARGVEDIPDSFLIMARHASRLRQDRRNCFHHPSDE